jgi:hypothetical protein
VKVSADGSEVLSFSPSKEYSCVMVSTPGLDGATSITVSAGGSDLSGDINGTVTQLGTRTSMIGGMGTGFGMGKKAGKETIEGESGSEAVAS